MLRLCLLQYIYGDSDREVVANARINLAYNYFLELAVDEERLFIDYAKVEKEFLAFAGE